MFPMLAFVLVLALSACDSAPAEPSVRSAPAATVTWVDVASWSGSGMKETESFVTTAREWRVAWSSTNETMPGASLIQIYAYRTDDGTLVSLMANKQGPGGDVSYVRTPPGRHHLMINSGNADWTVTVQEQR